MDFGYGSALASPTPEVPRHELLLPSDLRAVALETSTRLALPVNMVVRDYFMHQLLGAVAQVFPPGDAIAATAHGEPVDVAGWGFGGGTSLVSGHRLVERFSEDIDLVVYVPRDFPVTARRGLCSKFCDRAVEAFREEYPNITVTTGGSDFKTAAIEMGGGRLPLRIDVGPTFDAPGTREVKTVECLMARYGPQELVAEHPELRIENIPLVPASVTAANKLATLRGRAVQRNLPVLRGRGRDLYDLASMRRHAATVSAIAEEILRRVKTGQDTPGPLRPKWYAPRPAYGYADSPALNLGTAASVAALEGYSSEQVQGNLFLQSERWDSTQVIELVAQLDDHRHKAGDESEGSVGGTPGS